jgi:hypothetical protein
MSEKGKCYSKVDMGQRNKSDFYQTPKLMTQALLDTGIFSGISSVLEPACGQHAITNVLYPKFQIIQYYDLYIGDRRMDFRDEARQFDCIITNPPYKLANEFILKAQTVATRMFAMLLPLNYLQGQKRYEEIFTSTKRMYKLKHVFVFTRMPMLSDTVRADGKYKTGMQAYCWYVWVNGYQGHPVIDWLDSKEHIVKGNEDD